MNVSEASLDKSARIQQMLLTDKNVGEKNTRDNKIPSEKY